MKLTKLAVLAITIMLVFAGFACGGSTAAKTTITITNNSGYDIYEMMISKSDIDAEWSDNVLGKTIAAGATVEIEKSLFTESGKYDITFTDVEEGDYFYFDINPKTKSSLTIAAKDREFIDMDAE